MFELKYVQWVNSLADICLVKPLFGFDLNKELIDNRVMNFGNTAAGHRCCGVGSRHAISGPCCSLHRWRFVIE